MYDPDAPCEREYDPSKDPEAPDYWCVNDHTGCLWNDSNNGCAHPGESNFPLNEPDPEPSHA
jgi:hypothetical protein